MPARKRGLDFDPNKSNSSDSDFDEREARAARRKTAKVNNKRPARKKRRTGYGSNESEDISDSEVIGSESYEEEEEVEEAPIDPKTGRPLRKATQRKVDYGESDRDSDEFLQEIEPEEKKKTSSKSKKKEAATPPKKYIIKLKVTPGPSTRNTRTRSTSIVSKRPGTADSTAGATRRSSRIAHDDTEGLVALTNSGNHVEVTRPGTRSPEVGHRPSKGGKGLKKPPSAIFEEENESSAQTKEEPVDTMELDPEIAASREDLVTDVEDLQEEEIGREGSAVVPESNESDADAEDEEDEDIQAPRRGSRRGRPQPTVEIPDEVIEEPMGRTTRRSLRSAAQARTAHSSQRGKKRGIDDTSDFEPAVDEAGEENISSGSDSEGSVQKDSQEQDSSDARRSKRLKRDTGRVSMAAASEAEELAEELEELRGSRSRRAPRLIRQSSSDRPQTRKRKPVDYRIIRPDQIPNLEDDALPATSTPRKRGGAGKGWERSLFSTFGPFGGAGGPPPVLGGPGGIGATGGVDSDSSDDDATQRPRLGGVGGVVGMTPTSAAPPGFGLFPAAAAQPHSNDALQSSLGKVKDKQALADADPLGVDQHVNFDSVGGLQGHVDRLKEMVLLPLLYPEIFKQFKVTPPRGVLFHGPPGTGKTLLARALASSVSSGGKKVTFYMRKGADALSKWVGEAERQLRLLFEEARKNQPSIIFFDEIDGLAPVRSSKQEQIHASIVSTLLALMDGMDGRGQVIVIGATNRPDSVDPALRRPGRFDREFYFPLPNVEARRAILDIHTKGWDPAVPETLKKELAELTKGYGGADLRALCTEAALNAVQRRYPQIYKSNEKLLIEPNTINITAKDFMISVKKMVPSSERSTSSGAAPLPNSIEPLLRDSLEEVERILTEILPQKKRLTALEEAEFEDAASDKGIGMEKTQQEFERSRVFRPRLLIRGIPGMGQQYLAGALLNHFEGLHVQSFDLPTLLSDSTRSAEAAVVQFFAEIKRHKPSVIYIPNVDTWYGTVGSTVISTFLGLLRSLPPTDPVLLLGVLENIDENVDPQMVKDLFGFSRKNQYTLQKPKRHSREEFFSNVVNYLNASPAEFPDPADRKKRILETLPLAPPEKEKTPPPPTREELKVQSKKDRITLNALKLRIQPIMDQIKLKYKKFRTPIIDETAIGYLYDDANPEIVTSDAPHEIQAQATFRPYEKGKDERGEPGLLEVASGKFYYNMEIVTIEKRLSNGYYKRPKDFLSDIKKLAKDAKTVGDTDRLLKANELQANVEVDMADIEMGNPQLIIECEAVYQRELKREKERIEKAKRLAEAEGRQPEPIMSNLPLNDLVSNVEQSSGAIVLGQQHPNVVRPRPVTPLRQSDHSTLTNGISDLSNLQGHGRDSSSTSGPSKGEDTRMTNSDDSPSTHRETQTSSFGPSAQARPLHYHTGGPASLQQRLSYPGSLSQKSAITPMAEGSNPNMYANSASTTSSDKRNTGETAPYAQQSVQFESQSQSGQAETKSREGAADLSSLWGAPPSNSQLPDTQPETSSSLVSSSQSLPPSQPSQVPNVPLFSRHQPSAIHSLLNEEPGHPPLATDRTKAREFLEELVAKTSPCSVEQLEQVYSGLMSEIWRTRGSWNRVGVIETVGIVLDDLLEDMGACQEFGQASMDMGPYR